jgi:hypothetical protein
MQIIQSKKRSRRLLKVSLIILGIFAMISLGFHIWFVNNARNLIKKIVVNKSHGKLKIELSQVSFDFFSNKLKVQEAILVSTDSLSAPTSYHIQFSKLVLKTGSFWSLLFHNRLDLDSIKLHDPEIVVTQLFRDSTSDIAKDELSISQEMGKLYNSMLDGFDAFGIRRIMISNAKVTLVNKMKPGSEPITISDINFNMVRTAKRANHRDEFVEHEQSVDLKTNDQNIALPGGRLRLAFRKFNLQLFSKRIELDSCTVSSTATDSLQSTYTIFFNKLLLVGVDFDAMYRHNLIKADSVYCENPLFDFRINTLSASTAKNEKPDPEKIIRELTGDLDLAFVGVKDAGIHINITGSRNRSLFNSNKDDFEMHGFRVNADSSQPVVVGRFDMLVRDYHLYNEDSSAAYTLDSIHFINNKIILNNFSVITSSNPTRVRSERNFKIPYFELTGLDWYQLIFEENLVAKEAVLYNPIINYIKRTPQRTHKKTDIFRSLQTLDDLITLNKISVINGQINMKLGPSTSFQLQDANISLSTERLPQPGSNAGLRNAIDKLSFSNAVFHFNDMTVVIQNASNRVNTLLHADKVLITKAKEANVSVNDVYIDNFFVNGNSETMLIDGLKWSSAKIQIHAVQDQKTQGSGIGNIQLENISGNNSELVFSNGKNSISSFVQSLQIGSLAKNTKGIMQVKGFSMAGKRLSVSGTTLNIKVSSYSIAGDKPSFLSDLEIGNIKQYDTLSVKAPRVNFNADINSILAKDIHLTSLEAAQAVIKIAKWSNETTGAAENGKMLIRIDRITARQPDIYFSAHRDDSVMIVRVPHAENSTVKAEGLQLSKEGIQLASLSVNTTSASLVKRTGEIVGVEKGKVDITLSNMHLSKKDEKFSWAAMINTLYLKTPNNFALGNNQSLQFEETSIGNLNLSSDYINDFNTLVKFNISAWLRTTTGQYTDKRVSLKWNNAAYDFGKKTLSLDSFAYRPAQSRDSVMAHTPFETDYITLRSGAVRLTGFNLDRYEKDSSVIADTMEVLNPLITIYRDKQPPILAGSHKPLPVDMIRMITFPVAVRKLKLVDGYLSYTEKNAKTRAEGTLFLTHMNAEISHIKNRNLEEHDSLLLTMKAWLMDSTLLRLMVKESYHDTLSGFLMTLQVKPTTLSFLNPVLVPLSNIKITSGTVDSFQLRAIGHENLSIGEMRMYYHNLRIRLVKDGNEAKSGLIGRVVTFLANTFVIKKNNKGRAGIVYFERVKDRSFFNYIVRMTFSGMATSIGVKKNRKFLKQYKRELKQQNLPPIEFKYSDGVL